MNSQDILTALTAARTFKPEEKLTPVAVTPIRNDMSFVSMYDQLDNLDANPFNTPRTTK